MDTLRVLLVDEDTEESERLAGRLEQAHHAVLSAGGLEEATQALEMQRFDAVVVSSKLIGDELPVFRKKLIGYQSNGKSQTHVPFVCYAGTGPEQPSPAELARWEVDACLPRDFEAPLFSQFIARLAAELCVSRASHGQSGGPVLPSFQSDSFQEQLDYDRELIEEILDLFFGDSERQMSDMRSALQAGDLPGVSRLAHSIKGSLGSLYAIDAAARAQVLEQLAKAGDEVNSRAAFGGLERALAVLQPELMQLRHPELHS